jgi:hypothetical protein
LASNGIKELGGLYGTTASRYRATLNKGAGHATCHLYGGIGMRRHHLPAQGLLCAVYWLFLSTIIMNVGCSSSALSRETALDLLKKSPDDILGLSATTLKIKTSFNLMDVVANKGEVERTAPLDWSSFPKGSMLDVKLAQLMEKEGILELTYIQNTKWYGPLLDLRYDPVPGPEVQLVERKTGYYSANTVEFTVAHPSIKEVKGIVQDENSAQVEVLISLTPTQIYNRLAKCANELFQQEGLAQGDCNDCTAENILKIRDKFSPIERKYQFAKYDDGWRVMKGKF